MFMMETEGSTPLKVAVLISGTGRLLNHLIKFSHQTPWLEIAFVSSNKKCSGIKYAEQDNIPVYVMPNIADVICEVVPHYKVDLICLAGFLRKVNVISGWENRVINIHPSITPNHCGKGMYGMKVHKSVIESGDKVSGCTVHFCDNDYDTGPVILQSKLNVSPEWDAQSLADNVFELEKKSYVEALKKYYRSPTIGQ